MLLITIINVIIILSINKFSQIITHFNVLIFFLLKLPTVSDLYICIIDICNCTVLSSTTNTKLLDF